MARFLEDRIRGKICDLVICACVAPALAMVKIDAQLVDLTMYGLERV
jgi:hypothetical protein